jgi:homoserine dehydrogenase
VVTNDAELAIERLLAGEYANTLFSAATGGVFAFLRMAASDYAVGNVDKLLVQNDSVASYIMNSMESENKNLDEAVHAAQWENIATGNPSQNLHGIVTRNRLILQIASIFGLMIKPESVKTLGINTLSPEDVALAGELDCSIRLLGLAQLQNGKMRAVVEPCLIPATYLLAQARAGSEIVYLMTSDGNSHVYSAPGSSFAGQIRAVLSDLAPCATQRPEIDIYHDEVDDFCDSFYLRIKLIDMNSTLAGVLQIFTRSAVEIVKIYQPEPRVSRETVDKTEQTLVIITGKTSRIKLEEVIAQIGEQIKLADIQSCFRFLRRD